MGKSSINGGFSIAMFHYQRVDGAMVLWVGWCPSWLNLERYGKVTLVLGC
jgi:hypothetical protein